MNAQRVRAKSAAFVLFALLALTAAGPAPAADGAPSARSERPAVASFAITVRAGRFVPDRIDAPANTRLRIELTNEGPGPLEFENPELHVEKVLAAGARSVVVLAPLAPGEYGFVDEFNPVTGVLTVFAR